VGSGRPEPTAVGRPEVAVEAGDPEGRARLGRVERDVERGEGGAPTVIDPLDPMTRALFADGSQRLAFERSAAAAVPAAAPPQDAAAMAARVSLEHVMSRFVRRVAWSGDANAGTARLELGAGALSGATLTIHSEQGVVRVALELPAGVDAAEWRERIARRLEARGLQIAALDVA
jgi:hypothetical protein